MGVAATLPELIEWTLDIIARNTVYTIAHYEVLQSP